MQDDKLRACPFCGGDDIRTGLEGFCIWACGCDQCGAELQGADEAEAIAAWNRRALAETRPSEDAVERVLDKPAKVGAGTFGVGVPWSTVIGAAQRQHEYVQNPPFPNADMGKLHALIADTNAALAETRPLVERVGLSVARGIVEADLTAALETGDADWIGQARQAIYAVDAALAALEARVSVRVTPRMVNSAWTACLDADDVHTFHERVARHLNAALAAAPPVPDERMREALHNLFGQVDQARDGFGIYRDSPSMTAAMDEARAVLAATAPEVG